MPDASSFVVTPTRERNAVWSGGDRCRFEVGMKFKDGSIKKKLHNLYRFSILNQNGRVLRI